MNSANSITSDPHRQLLNLSGKIGLKRSDKYVALSNQILAYTIHGKIQKRYTKTINLRHQLQYGMVNLNYLKDRILYQIFKNILIMS